MSLVIQKSLQKILFLTVIWSTLMIHGSISQNINLINLEAKKRILTKDKTYKVITQELKWIPSETAIIICDMWNEHWCKGATARVAELAPHINSFANIARQQGVLIVHAPSGVVKYYEDYPEQKRIKELKKAVNLPKGINKWNHGIESENKDNWPIDQSDGGCDCDPQCQQESPWKQQIESIQILPEDAISDSGEEIWNLFEENNIKNVALVGVHTNMCVIGRPFGLRNMKKFGKNVVLVRDLTDTMYNSRMRPFVNHFKGTELIIEYIEKYVCPTITSSELTGKSSFNFQENNN
jgi:nicotinamidase-related amidase